MLKQSMCVCGTALSHTDSIELQFVFTAALHNMHSTRLTHVLLKLVLAAGSHASKLQLMHPRHGGPTYSRSRSHSIACTYCVQLLAWIYSLS